MSQLEDEAKPLLVPILEGQNRLCTARDQRTITRWAIKTSLVAGSKFESPTPAIFYERFFASGEPPPFSCVWMGASPWQQMTYVDYRPIKVWAEGVEPKESNAYGATLAVGHLVLHILAWIEGEPPTARIESDFVLRRRLIRISPQQGRKRWPPRGERLDFDALDALADAVVQSSGESDGEEKAPGDPSR